MMHGWLWVAVVEPIHYRILGVHISCHRNMLVAESFLKSLTKLYRRHAVYSDGGSWYPEGPVHLRHISFIEIFEKIQPID
jgi:putative transposase